MAIGRTIGKDGLQQIREKNNIIDAKELEATERETKIALQKGHQKNSNSDMNKKGGAG